MIRAGAAVCLCVQCFVFRAFKKSFYRSLISSTVSANTAPQILKINQEKQPLKLYRFHATLFFRHPYQCQSMLLKANFVVVLFSPAIHHCLVMMSNHDNAMIVARRRRQPECNRRPPHHRHIIDIWHHIFNHGCIFDVRQTIAFCRFHNSHGQQCVCVFMKTLNHSPFTYSIFNEMAEAAKTEECAANEDRKEDKENGKSESRKEKMRYKMKTE